jgi:hypothetical protein
MRQHITVRKERWSRTITGLFLILLLWPTLSMAGEVTLAWDANSETNLAGYKLYYDGDSDSETYGGTDANQGDSPIVIYLDDLEDADSPVFSLSGLTAGEYYYFSLTAFDSDGMESDFSDEVGVMIEEETYTVSSGGGDSGSGCFISTATPEAARFFPVTAIGIFLLGAIATVSPRKYRRHSGHVPRQGVGTP